MTRPRFHKLAADQQERIARAALAEFAAHGFADASLNRIIDAAGISKGSLYYYFDDKADLYAHVARAELEGLVKQEGPFPMPADVDVERFWATLTDYYLRSMRALLASAESAALLRGWLSAAGSPALQAVQAEVEQAALPWFLDVLAAGQKIGAVRTDLPTDLLVAVALGMGQAMDVWLITAADAAPDGEKPWTIDEAVPVLIEMIRRAVQP